MPNKNLSNVDAKNYFKESFHLDILICGDYSELNIAKELGIVKFINKKDLPIVKQGIHNLLQEWSYYFFDKDEKLGENLFKFIKDSKIREKGSNNIILFYPGLIYFNIENLTEFLKQKSIYYFTNIIIIRKKREALILPQLKRIENYLIRDAKQYNISNIFWNFKEISSYYNDLGNDIIIHFMDKIKEKCNEFLIYNLSIFNIIVRGRTFCGKSTLINRILEKEKTISGKGATPINFSNYIYDKTPIILLDTPGIVDELDISRVQKFIIEEINEERNMINCVFCINNIHTEFF